MKSGEKPYIWQQPDWPNWHFDLSTLIGPLTEVSRVQGLLLGRLADVGMGLREQASLTTLTEDILKTSEIEGEKLDADSVRSSVARHLGVGIGALAPVDRNVEGVVDMVLDATTNYAQPVSLERLLGWHAALFPTGYSGMSPIRAGHFRDDAEGPMQVVSGPVNRRRVHFEAPPAGSLLMEVNRFLDWLNGSDADPPLIKAGLAHLWFVTLHPFDDGNGRIARAIGDLLLARAEGNAQRFYSLSAQIQKHRKAYYEILERTQKGTLDVTAWLAWFLDTLRGAVEDAHRELDCVLAKSIFWQRWAGTPLNKRQVKVLNRMLDSFEGKLTSSKWASMAKCSSDTALRDINELLSRGILRKCPSGGRSTAYEISD
jgi:Fic family protein